MIHRHPIVENETLALPGRVLGRHLFQVFQNASAQVKNLLKPLFQHESRGLLTAYATSTEHRHLAVSGRVKMLTHVGGELAKVGGVRRYCTPERANAALVVIARVE